MIVDTIATDTYSGAKQYLVSHQLCKFSHLKRWERPVIFIIGIPQLSRKSHCRIFKEFLCILWWKIRIWSITKFNLNTLLYTLCWQWQRSNVFCKSFHTLLLVFWPIPPCRSPLEQWCFEAVAGQHGLSTPSKYFLWGWDLETGCHGTESSRSNSEWKQNLFRNQRPCRCRSIGRAGADLIGSAGAVSPAEQSFQPGQRIQSGPVRESTETWPGENSLRTWKTDTEN